MTRGGDGEWLDAIQGNRFPARTNTSGVYPVIFLITPGNAVIFGPSPRPESRWQSSGTNSIADGMSGRIDGGGVLQGSHAI